MLVQEWMSTDVVAVEPSMRVLQAKRLMGERRIRRLPVAVGNTLVGILTDRDLREFTPSKASSLDIYEMHFILDRLTVGELMTKDPISVRPRSTLEDAAAVMCTRKIGGLPVTELDGPLVGVITETDVFRAFVQVSGGTRAGVRIEVEAHAGGPSVSQIAKILEDQGAPLLSFLTGPERGPDSKRSIVFRLAPTDAFLPDRVETTLKAAGVTVCDVRSIG